MNYYEGRDKTYGCGWPSFFLEMKYITFARNCHASEASAVATRLVALYEGMEFPEDSYLRNAMSDFKDLAVRIDSAVDRKVRAAYDTEDAQRAQCLRSLYHLLRSAVASQDANVSAHAAVVYQAFRSCGLSVLHKGLDERTGHIDSLLTDLSATEIQSHIAAVPGLADSISQLETAQQAFEAKRVDYQSRRGAMQNSDCASALKLRVMDMVNNTILPYFGTMAKVKGGVYADFNDTLCQVVASANASAKLHSRRKKTETEAKPAYVAPTNEEEEPLTA